MRDSGKNFLLAKTSRCTVCAFTMDIQCTILLEIFTKSNFLIGKKFIHIENEVTFIMLVEIYSTK